MTIEKSINAIIKDYPIRIERLELYKGRFESSFIINGERRHCISSSFKKGGAILSANSVAHAIIEWAREKELI